jgi:hypothetical protein
LLFIVQFRLVESKSNQLNLEPDGSYFGRPLMTQRNRAAVTIKAKGQTAQQIDSFGPRHRLGRPVAAASPQLNS